MPRRTIGVTSTLTARRASPSLEDFATLTSCLTRQLRHAVREKLRGFLSWQAVRLTAKLAVHGLRRTVVFVTLQPARVELNRAPEVVLGLLLNRDLDTAV